MVEVKLADIVNSRDVLMRIMNEKLPANISFKLGKAFKAISAELDDVEKERQRLIHDLGEPIDPLDESKGWQVKKENNPKFHEEFLSILEEKVSVNYDPIPSSVLEKISEQLSISPADMSRVDFLFK